MTAYGGRGKVSAKGQVYLGTNIVEVRAHRVRRMVRSVSKLILFCLLKGYGIEDVQELVVRSRRFGFVRRSHLAAHVLRPFQRANVIFVHIPRNAGTSIADALYGQKITHYSALFYRNLDRDFYSSVPSFAILRDPVDRFVSSYYFIKNGGGADVRLEWLWKRIYASHLGDLDEFLLFQAKLMRRYRRTDYATRPQVGFVTDRNGNVIVDNLFVLGKQDEELREFLKLHGVSDLPLLNGAVREEVQIAEHQAQMIRDLYRDDVALIERVSTRQTVVGRSPAAPDRCDV